MSTVCAVCGAALAPSEGRGRPRTYCSPRCRKLAELEVRHERRRAWLREHYPGLAPRTATDEDLWALEEANEALAKMANVERQLLLAMVPAEHHRELQFRDPALANSAPLYGLLPSGEAVRVLRFPGETLVLCQKFDRGQLVEEGILDPDAVGG